MILNKFAIKSNEWKYQSVLELVEIAFELRQRWIQGIGGCDGIVDPAGAVDLHQEDGDLRRDRRHHLPIGLLRVALHHLFDDLQQTIIHPLRIHQHSFNQLDADQS